MFNGEEDDLTCCGRMQYHRPGGIPLNQANSIRNEILSGCRNDENKSLLFGRLVDLAKIVTVFAPAIIMMMFAKLGSIS